MDTMQVERAFPSGAWLISDIIDGHLVHRVYYGYAKREAIAEFKAEFKVAK